MSIAVLVISLLFAVVEVGVSWLLLTFEPVSQLLTDVPSIVTTGAIFGIGMILTFIIIFLVGGMNVSEDAASFVRDHKGRTVALAFISVIAIIVVSVLGEMLYQADPLPSRQVPSEADICFALDFSFSMTYDADPDGNNYPVNIDISTISSPSEGNDYKAGETVQYKIDVKNVSGQLLEDIAVKCEQSGDQWEIPSLSPGAGQTYFTSYTLTANDVAEDFYFKVSAQCGNVQIENNTGKATYALAFLHSAEATGMTEKQYYYVDEVNWRVDSLKAAFANTLRQMSPTQKVCVIIYRDEPQLLVDWCELTQENQDTIIQSIEKEEAKGPTDFARALAMADEQVKKALQDKRHAAVIMLSDGEDPKFTSTADSAPTIMAKGIHVNTVLISELDEAATLSQIAAETGGQFTSTTAELTELTQAMVDTVDVVKADVNTNGIPDTLITERYVSRQTIINARALRIIILFLIGFFFKLVAVICIGNNKRSIVPHLLKAIFIGALAAFWVEFGYVWGLPLLLVLGVFWVLLMAQIVTSD